MNQYLVSRAFVICGFIWLVCIVYWTINSLSNFKSTPEPTPTRHLTVSDVKYINTWKSTDDIKSINSIEKKYNIVLGMATLPSDDRVMRKTLLNYMTIFMKSFRKYHTDSNIYKLYLFTEYSDIVCYNDSSEYDNYHNYDDHDTTHIIPK